MKPSPSAWQTSSTSALSRSPRLKRFWTETTSTIAARGGELLEADVGDADLAHLALVLQLLQRPDRLLVGDVGIGCVQLVEVDPLEPQAAQRALAGRAQVLRAPARLPPARPGRREAALGGDREALGIGMERLGDQFLADLRAVGVGGVDQVDAELERAAQDREGFLVVGRRSPDALAGDPHRAEAQPAYLELAEAEGADGLVGDRVDRHRPTG